MYHCSELFESYEIFGVFFRGHSSLLPAILPSHHEENHLDVRACGLLGQLAILVQQSHGISFCLVHLRPGLTAVGFHFPSDCSLGENLVFYKAVRGH